MFIFPPPNSENELMHRASVLAGCSVSFLAKKMNIHVPKNLNKNKGWIGLLIERFLGANAGNQAKRDFEYLGIELKTIPIGKNGKPLETTFISTAPLKDCIGLTWENSHVKYKLSKVLWIPIEGDRQIPLAKRKFGFPILWEPLQEEEKLLKQDWEELMDLIALGKIKSLNSKFGQVLQIRPKAANRKILTDAIGENGETVLTNPRGFYLKKSFTYNILTQNFKRQAHEIK